MEAFEKSIYKYASAVERKIKDIDPAKDAKVKVLGIVVNKGIAEGSFIIDDGSGQALISIDDPTLLDNIKEGIPVRVLGVPIKRETTIEIMAEILQNMEKLDMELFKQIKEIEEKIKKSRF
ncbi:MAG: hypothetical protein HY929_05190 [Euryarchaeota archaeon]|nr:hypothetical protein [Euryarchaeota archaeon]